MSRIIFHVDVNNAYLSWSAVYLLQNGFKEDIRTIPSVIGGDEENRHGIVLAKSPIAKKYGIVSAETIYSAKKKCKDLKVFPPVFDYYMEQSNNFYNYLKQYTPLIERASVDECFLDLTDTKYLYDDILSLAYKIKNDIKSQFGFTVNVGIASNKLCAKMASDFEKPDKVHTLFDYEIKDKMWPLPINNLLFVGKKTTLILQSIGINTIGDLANCELSKLEKYFKNKYKDLVMFSRGIDNSPVIPDYGLNKCISISRTLKEDTNDLNYIKKILLNMSNQVGLRARKNGLYANTIAITFKSSSFKAYSHQTKLINPINTTMDIYKEVLKLLQEAYIKEKIRSIGIRLDNLSSDNKKQISLFDNQKDSELIQKLMDDINVKYRDTAILPASFYTKNSK